MLYIYKASAGSGKTFTLTYHYIKLLLGAKNSDGTYSLAPRDNDNQRHILAVTFTNKATEEMKSRIIHELAVLGGMESGWTSPSPYRDRLMAEFRCTDDELRFAAADSLVKLLFDFTFFQVSTIDSFFQTILRTFAHDLDMTGNYEVDLDSRKIIAVAVRDLFDTLRYSPATNDNRQVIEWVWQYLNTLFSRGKATNLFNRKSSTHASIVRLIDSLSNEKFTLFHDEMMEYMRDFKQQRLSKILEDAAAAMTDNCMRQCRETLVYISDNAYDGSVKNRGKVSAPFCKLLQNYIESGECNLKSKTLAKALSDAEEVYSADLRKWLSANPDNELGARVTASANSMNDTVRQTTLINTIRSNLFVLGIMERVYRNIEEYHNDNNTMLLGDASGMLSSILGDESDVPFVFDRIGVWLNNFLIDEFQDTSELQWENMRPLLSDAQSYGHDSLIIGDEKQCIYRFRFSDPTLLQYKVSDSFGGNSLVQGDKPEENTNWRSTADVVNFNNALFGILSNETGLNGVYSGVMQQVAPKNTNFRGYVEANRIAASDADREETALSNMLSAMRREIKAGYRGCDIAVLTRKRREAAAVIAYLQKHLPQDPELRHLRIISDDALYLSTSPAVRIIVSVLQNLAEEMSASSGNEVEEQSILRNQEKLLSLLNRYNYISSHGATPEAALHEALIDKNSTSLLESLEIDNMVCYSVPSVVERIIKRFISPEMAERQNMFISAFQDVVIEYFEYNTGDLHSFLTWWDNYGSRSTVSSAFDSNAVRVMTIHKSKGLEFGCVHIPFANWKMVDFKGYEWFDTDDVTGIDRSMLPKLLPLKPGADLLGTWFDRQYKARRSEQILDELNVLYVSFTRAVSELIISYNDPGNEREEEPTLEGLTVNRLLQNALTRIDGGRDVVPDEPDSTIDTKVWGEPTSACAEEKHQPTTLDPIANDEMPPYLTDDRVDLWAQIRLDEIEPRTEAQQWGITLHGVLAHVRVASDLPKAIRRRINCGALSRSDAPKVMEVLSRELSRDDVSGWFSPECRVAMEREFHNANGKSRRPDRIVWHPDGSVSVIDYKTGEEVETGVYRNQVRNYMKLLAGTVRNGIRGYIWYLATGTIEEVTATS